MHSSWSLSLVSHDRILNIPREQPPLFRAARGPCSTTRRHYNLLPTCHTDGAHWTIRYNHSVSPLPTFSYTSLCDLFLPILPRLRAYTPVHFHPSYPHYKQNPRYPVTYSLQPFQFRTRHLIAFANTYPPPKHPYPSLHEYN